MEKKFDASAQEQMKREERRRKYSDMRVAPTEAKLL
jgi:hypothetical protein